MPKRDLYTGEKPRWPQGQPVPRSLSRGPGVLYFYFSGTGLVGEA